MTDVAKNIGLFNDFDYLKVSISSPEKILARSYGEVKSSSTINYKTFKPEKDGLFCSRIFGPVSNYECLCGKYRGYKYNGLKCEKCLVDIVLSSVRRERMGHINLAYPVVNILFLNSNSSKLAMLLNLKAKDIESVVYFEKYIVLDAGVTKLKKMQLLSFEEYQNSLLEFGSGSFDVGIGADGILKLLRAFDLDKEYQEAKKALASTKQELKKIKLKNRVKILMDFIKSGNKPEWMVLTVLPVLPPDIRPIVVMEGNTVAVSDLNLLYARIINRNNRIKRLIELQAPDVILHNEYKMLQSAVNNLFVSSNASGRQSINQRSLKSISDCLNGKQGIIRQNLLGKRVDYSGRSVIVSGPELKLHQCGLPKDIALELFKPFILSRLKVLNKITTIKQGLDMINRKVPEVFECLEKIVVEHPILLNRAPTLHRLGIQAFEPILIDTKAIQLHPLVCRGFNADFDGDQMAVHLPLSIEAQLEARIIMLATNNILSLSDGKPTIVPRKDITVGLYYMTTIFNGQKNEGHTFYSYYDALSAFNNKDITLNTRINCYIKLKGSDNKVVLLKDTNIGRLMLMRYLPCDGKISFDYLNRQWSIGFLNELIENVFFVYGNKITVIFCDKIMKDGFKYATRSGISFGKDDICVPENKQEIVNGVMDNVRETEQQYRDGYITKKERYNKITDYWTECGDILCNEIMSQLSKNIDNEKINSISLMMNSGARASKTQMKQLAGMKGLITKPNGEIIEVPVISNFKEGLNIMEFFNAAHGARKGNVDTALKTADAGYLTRRLVDAAQDCVVIEEDCGCDDGIEYSVGVKDGVADEKISESVFGRFLLRDVVNNGNVIVKAGTLIDRNIASILDNNNISSVVVRSPVTCKCKNGICRKCYGLDMSTMRVVNLGEAVGTIAAQTIGEPGTQLTLNTFHIGGVVRKDVGESTIKANASGKVKYNNLSVVVNKKGEKIASSHTGYIDILDDNGNIISSHSVEYSSTVFVQESDSVKAGDVLYEYDPYNIYIISGYSGKVSYHNIILNESYVEQRDGLMGISKSVIVNWKTKNLMPSVYILDENGKRVVDEHNIEISYLLPVGAILNVKDGEAISSGDVIAKVPRELNVIKDITGGLPRVDDLFEARIPKNSAIIAGADGYVEFGKDRKSSFDLVLHADDSNIGDITYNIPKGRYITVRNGEKVKKGHIFVSGEMNPHDLLKYNGITAVTTYIVSQVQSVYKSQGISINGKHIEVIVRYMLNNVIIDQANDTTFINDEKYNVEDVINENDKVIARGGTPATYHHILSGISQSAINTSSFLSAASFKETVKVLISAAICGKKDNLVGMKESMIVGRLIPSGTGFVTRQLKKMAIDNITNAN